MLVEGSAIQNDCTLVKKEESGKPLPSQRFAGFFFFARSGSGGGYAAVMWARPYHSHSMVAGGLEVMS